MLTNAPLLKTLALNQLGVITEMTYEENET